MLLLLLLSCQLALLGANKIRHQRNLYYQPNGDLCQLPPISEEDGFRETCATYIRKRYVCSPPDNPYISQSEVDNIEDEIAGQFAFCRYDALAIMAEPRPIGDKKIWEEYWKQKEEEEKRENQPMPRNAKAKHSNQQDSVLMRLRPMDDRPNIGITMFNGLNLYDEPSAAYCLLKMPTTLSRNISSYLQYYANVSRSKWSFSTCKADIAILIAIDPVFTKGANPRKGFYWATSFNYGGKFTALVPVLHDLVRKANAPPEESDPGQEKLSLLLKKFLKELAERLDHLYPHKPDHVVHTVPSWAIATFIVCIALTVIATFLGSWVTNTKKQARLRHKFPSMRQRRPSFWRRRHNQLAVLHNLRKPMGLMGGFVGKKNVKNTKPWQFAGYRRSVAVGPDPHMSSNKGGTGGDARKWKAGFSGGMWAS